MWYSIFQLDDFENIRPIIGITREQTESAVNAYLEGKSEPTIGGRKRYISSSCFVIYEMNEEAGTTGTQIQHLFEKNARIFYSDRFHEGIFQEYGNDVTETFLQGRAFGSVVTDTLLSNQSNEYANLTRLAQLKAIQSNAFDLKRLICLCEELNSASANESWHSVTLLVRAIIDHVPPIFGSPNFAHVASSGSRSFNESMAHLQTSMRKIADAHLHTHIRSSEVLPNRTQVDCARELDVLLAEIVRRLQ